MATIKSEIIAINPLCTPKFLSDKSDLALDNIRAYYKERENWIDYYIKVLKENYAKYGYDNPFLEAGKEDKRFISANFGSETMQKKIKVVYHYEPTWSKGIGEAIDEYIARRTSKYFGPNEVLDFSYKNYFYLLALDETIYNLYKDHKKYLDKTKNKTINNEDLIKDFVEIALGIKHKSYEDEIMYVNEDELNDMGFDELPEGYEFDNFLGPKGPGR